MTEHNSLMTLKNTLELLPIIVILVISFSFLDLFYYYREFGVDIYHYLDASEVAFSFSNILYFLVLSIMLIYFPWLIAKEFDNLTGFKPAFLKNIEKKLDKLNPSKFATLVLVLVPIFIIIFIGYLTLQLCLHFVNYLQLNTDPQYFELIICSCVILIILLVFRIDKLNKTFMLTALIFLFMWYLEFTNERKAKRLPTHYVNLTLKDGRIVTTSDNYYFIGATRNFFFFRNLRSELNIIIPKSEVAEIHQRSLKKKTEILGSP